MKTYTTLDSTAVDLSALTDEEQAYPRSCLAAYCANMDWDDFSRLVNGDENPLIRDTGGQITRTVYEHPLFRALRDREARIGIRQGFLNPAAGDDVNQEPYTDSPTAASGMTPGIDPLTRRPP